MRPFMLVAGAAGMASVLPSTRSFATLAPSTESCKVVWGGLARRCDHSNTCPLRMSTELHSSESGRARLEGRRRTRVSRPEPEIQITPLANDDSDEEAPMIHVQSENRNSRRRARRNRERERLLDVSTSSSVELTEEEIEEQSWRQSVFEFKSINDQTHRKNYANPPPRKISVSDVQSQAPEYAEPNAPGLDAEWFRFSEKEPLAPLPTMPKSSPNVSLSVLGRPGTRLIAMLGLSADCSYEKLRSTYRMELKRCHPDISTASGSEYLNTRFQRLTNAWQELQAHPAARALEEGAAGLASGHRAGPVKLRNRYSIRMASAAASTTVIYEPGCEDTAGSSC